MVLLVFSYHDTQAWRSLKGIVMTLFVGVGLLLGVVLGAFVFWPVLRVVCYWRPISSDSEWVLATVIVAMVAAWGFISWLQKEPGIEMFRRFSSSMRLVAESCVIAIAAVTLTSFMALTYPHEVSQSIGPTWSRFRDFAVVWLSISIISAACIHLVAERKIEDLAPVALSLPSFTRKRAKPTGYARARKVFGKSGVRSFLKALFLVLLILFATVFVDQNSVIFVPKVSVGQERPYASGCPTVGHLVLVRLENGSDRFYQLMQSTYTVTIPYIRHLVDQVYVANPSNFSGTSRALLPTSSDIDILWAQGSSGVSLDLKGSPGPVTAIVANLTAVSGRMANFTVFYSQEFLRRNVTVDAQRRIDATSHTYVYSFLFTDNENVCTIISRIEVPELSRGEVNSAGVKVYVEGSELLPSSVGVDGVLLAADYLYSGRTMNVTLVLPMKET
jgi:uncharacterized protein YggT (Ycf19 family)